MQRARAFPVRRKVLPMLLACLIACSAALPLKALADSWTNYSWYAGHELADAYTISTAGEMRALANLVNGTADYDGDGVVDAPVSFEGKTISLSGGLPVNFLGDDIDPIGTAAHPFEGTFDATQRQIDNFKISIPADSNRSVRDVGLFGHVGKNGKLVGVSVGARASISIVRSASSADHVVNVGLVAGYCGGMMSDCKNTGSVMVASEVAQASKSDYLPVRNIGGVVGQCVFDMIGCTNEGDVSVSETSSPVVAVERAQLVRCVGGVVGLFGDEALLGSHDKHFYGRADKHGSMDGCVNTGKISVDTPKLSGQDRFGSQTSAESAYIGGVVGYSQGSITNCTNGREKASAAGVDERDVGYVRAENGNIVGGVCGSLRGVLADNMNIAWADDGADGEDPLVMSRCSNYGDVYARVTVGGVLGKASSFTTVTECLNQNKRDYFGSMVPTYVVATRWNKPSPAGVVGTANGEVSYCSNFATVASALWDDEQARTLKTQDGYYAAGIVGMLAYFDDLAPQHGGITTPVSEVFSCYNAGSIIASSNMRQRGIVGQNDGYTHDNVLVKDLVYNDEIVYGDDPSESEASGAVGENRIYEAAELRGDKAAEAIAFMNGNSEANGWQRYWIMPQETSLASLNQGYPLLCSQNPWGDSAVSIAAVTASLATNAPYTGGVSVPHVSASLFGTMLVENADFRVVPQAGAVEPSTGGAYKAAIVGLGRYAGTAAQVIPYDIVAGDFNKCLLTTVAHTFDYEAYVPKADEVVVRTPAGTVVDCEEYTYELVDDAGMKIDAPVNAAIYRIVAKPKEGSTLFSGEVEGTFRIKPASFMREVSFDDVKVSYLGKEYPWVDSKNVGEADNPTTTLPYTGVSVKPEVGTIAYKGHELVEGIDYRIVYGNSNSDDGYPDDQDANNMGRKGGKTVGCVTIRNITSRQANFTSYSNMFFNIVDTGTKADLSQASFKVEGEQISDGNPLEPVELYLGRAKLTRDVDYAIEYRDNVNPGVATFTATGQGAFTGTINGEFPIVAGDVYELSYAFSGTGAVDDPREATVTGVVYNGSRSAFHLVIPPSVEHEGDEYSVVAVADSAFGGNGAASFTGQPENVSKMKITSVSIPASVRSIGAFAFGTSSITMPVTPPLASVEIADGSQLASIGEYAFAQCEQLSSFTFGERVTDIADNAFYNCKALRELRFLTNDAELPGSVGAKAFSGCSGVVVRGYSGASAVERIASENAASKVGTNGGRNFTFELLASLAEASITAIPDQVYTGKALMPKLVVTLGGGRLAEGVDYTLSYEDNVDAGMAQVVVRGAGRMGGNAQVAFKINPAPLSKASFARLEDRQFSGAAVSIAAGLSLDGMELVEGRDYDLSYASGAGAAIEAPMEPGSYQLVATGKGNFTGTASRTFRIVAANVSQAVFSNIGSQAYGGVRLEPGVNAKLGETDLVCGRDYVVSYRENVDVGDGVAHVYGIGGLVGEAQLRFRIAAASLSSAKIAGVHDVQASSEGGAESFSPTVVVNGSLLEQGRDYEVSYKQVGSDGAASGDTSSFDSSIVGDCLLIVTGKGNYTGTAEAAFSITEGEPAGKVDLATSHAVVIFDVDTFDYDGTAHKPVVQVACENDKLEEGVDFVVSYEGNVDPGTAKLTVHGIGEFAGSVTKDFKVRASVIDNSCLAGFPDATYTGEAARPHPLVRVGGRILSEGVDFSVSYGDNTLPGRASVAVKGQGGYIGEATGEFMVSAVDISSADVRLEYGEARFTGTALRPDVFVSLEGRSLAPTADYDVAYERNTSVGEALVIVTGKRGYAGRVTAAFSIKPAVAAWPTAVEGLSYTGSELVGVAPGNGFSVVGGTAVDAGSYTARAVLDTGFIWPDSSSDERMVAYAIAPAPLAAASVVLEVPQVTYDGRKHRASVSAVTLGGSTLASDAYDLAVPVAVHAGRYAVVATGKGNYTGSAQTTFTVVKAANGITGKVAKSYKKSKLKRKARSFALPKAAYGTTTYKVASKDKKKSLSLKAKAGKVIVKKGAARGKYTIKVKASAKGGSDYAKLTRIVTVKVTVK